MASRQAGSSRCVQRPRRAAALLARSEVTLVLVTPNSSALSLHVRPWVSREADAVSQERGKKAREMADCQGDSFCFGFPAFVFLCTVCASPYFPFWYFGLEICT